MSIAVRNKYTWAQHRNLLKIVFLHSFDLSKDGCLWHNITCECFTSVWMFSFRLLGQPHWNGKKHKISSVKQNVTWPNASESFLLLLFLRMLTGQKPSYSTERQNSVELYVSTVSQYMKKFNFPQFSFAFLTFLHERGGDAFCGAAATWWFSLSATGCNVIPAAPWLIYH